MATITVSADFGYVVLVVVATWVLLNWMAMQVMKARKKFNVAYPNLYSPVSNDFNCIQRVHQNTIENIPAFLAFLILGGLQFPRLSAVFGVIFLLGRVVYAFGYYTGDPSKRNRGAFGYIGIIGLIINTILLALNLLGWI
ncbi:microsomal glutathione S-transferase 3-like [Pomacea canaliculata]|uniref:microsomal glutathione S-transferase 3-like n=1 Tax=Pomacea canaliculata TaxID=400727 RepID=UPI000D72EF06|nr:microsomal glutathione S-transferase 3-like [Pomacea canaliculata]